MIDKPMTLDMTNSVRTISSGMVDFSNKLEADGRTNESYDYLVDLKLDLNMLIQRADRLVKLL